MVSLQEILIFATVIGSSVWVLIDSSKLRENGKEVSRLAATSPLVWFVCCLLLWIVAFPLYLITRPKLLQAAAPSVEPKSDTNRFKFNKHTPITFSCGCGFSKQVAPDLHGKKAKCPKCGEVAVISAQQESPALVDVDAAIEFSNLQPDDYRDPSEKLSFYTGVVIIGLVLFGFSTITAGIGFLLLIPFSIFFVWKMRGEFLGSSVKISAQQFPEIYTSVQRAEARLNFSDVDVFVNQDKALNAHAFGLFGRKCIVLNTGIIDAMSPGELDFCVGHELSHIKCNHTVLGTLKGNASMGTGIPYLSQGLDFVTAWWGRRCEFTCDRGGLIACRDVDAAVGALTKLAVGKELFEKIDMEEYLSGQHAAATLTKVHGPQRFFDPTLIL